MIKITVEVWKHGFFSERKILGEALVINDGTGTPTHGNYTYALKSKGRAFREGKVTKFQRKKQNIWWLLYLIMKDAMWAQQGRQKRL